MASCALSDEDLLVLENVTYMWDGNEALFDAAFAGDEERRALCGSESSWENRTVGELVALFDEEALQRLESTDMIGHDEGSHWAAAIRYMQSSPEISGMKILDYEP